MTGQHYLMLLAVFSWGILVGYLLLPWVEQKLLRWEVRRFLVIWRELLEEEQRKLKK